MEAEAEIQSGDSTMNEGEQGDVTMKNPLIDVNVVEQKDMVFVLKISKSLHSATLVVCAEDIKCPLINSMIIGKQALHVLINCICLFMCAGKLGDSAVCAVCA
jgi:hypothetical protein